MFCCGPFFKVFIEFVTILLLFYVLVSWPQGIWVLSSPNRNLTRTSCIGRRSLNHWTAREVPVFAFLEPLSFVEVDVVAWNPYYAALPLHLWLLGYSLSDGNHRVGLPSGSVVKNLSAMQQMQVRSLGGEDPLEEEMATHFNILAWKIS